MYFNTIEQTAMADPQRQGVLCSPGFLCQVLVGLSRTVILFIVASGLTLIPPDERDALRATSGF
jgi:hypothetical protein